VPRQLSSFSMGTYELLVAKQDVHIGKKNPILVAARVVCEQRESTRKISRFLEMRYAPERRHVDALREQGFTPWNPHRGRIVESVFGGKS
jgi:hypothetical protein